MLFVNIFSQSLACFFILLVVSLEEEKILRNSTNSFFHVFSLWCYIYKVILSNPRHLGLLLSSSRSFIVFSWNIYACNHFKFISETGVRSVSRFTFFAYGYLVVSTPSIKKTIFFPLYYFCSFVKDQLTIFLRILGFLPYSSVCLFFCQYYIVFITVPHGGLTQDDLLSHFPYLELKLKGITKVKQSNILCCPIITKKH